MIRNYFKTAWRNLYRNKVYSVINIMGLSLGLACAILILLYVKDEVSYDGFHESKDQIYRIVTQGFNEDGSPDRKDSNTGYLQGPRFTEGVPEIKAFVRAQSGYRDIKIGTEVKPQDLLYVDSNFFEIFSFPLLQGNSTTCLQQTNAIVLSEDAAKKYFGTTNAVGKILLINENESFSPYTVTGVSKKCPQNSSIKFDALLPLQMPKDLGQDNETWFNFFLNTFVILEPDANIALVDKKIQSTYLAESSEAMKIIEAKYGDTGPALAYFLQPFTDMHLNPELPAQNGLSDASNPMYSYILSGIALFILLIACINFVNLTIARSIRRSKEIGIRKVIGGDRKQLIFQFLGESFLLCFLAFIMALLIVELVLPLFNVLSNKALSFSYLFDIKLVGAYIFLFIITGLLAGFYPAIILSGFKPVQTLYSRFMLSGKGYLQKSLVVLQFALASFLIMGTLIIYSQFKYLTSQELGYDDSNLVVINKRDLTKEQTALLRQQLLKHQNIIGVTAKNEGNWSTTAKVSGDKQVFFAYETVDESYLSLMKISLVKGRDFSREFPSDSTHSVIVNESFVKEAGWENPLGQEVNFWYNNNEKYNVIGIVEDYHFLSLNQKIKPQLFTMKPANVFGSALIKIKPNNTTASLDFIATTFKTMFQLSPYNYTFKDNENRQEYEAEEKWKQIMLFSAILTIFISCIGLFGLSVLSAEKRTKEIGIRKVLGASVNNVITTLSKDFIKLVLIAIILAVPLAWIVGNNWLQNYPYHIHIGWKTFVTTAILVVLVALTTVIFQAIRAAIANPVKSLRTE